MGGKAHDCLMDVKGISGAVLLVGDQEGDQPK